MERIVDGVHQVSGGVNSFIVDGDEGVVLVDTGLPRREGAIVDALSVIGRTPGDVTAIVLTHGHADHTGGAAALRRRSGADVVAPAGDAPAVEGRRPPSPPPLLDRPVLRLLAQLVPSAEGVAVDRVVADAGPLPVASDLVAIPTPGHTDGHTSYLLDRAGGVLFVGDAAVATRSGAVRRGIINRAGPTFDASLRAMAERDFAVACFGHARPIRGGAAGAFRRFVATIG